MLVGKLQSRPLCWHNTCCTHNSYKNVAVESSVMPSPWNLLAFSSKSVSNIFWKRICFLFVWPLKIQCIFKDTKVLQTFTPQRWSMASENGIIKKKLICDVTISQLWPMKLRSRSGKGLLLSMFFCSQNRSELLV